MRRRLLLSVWLGCSFLSAVAHAASTDLVPEEEYEKKINAAKVVSPLGSDFTGEQVSLYDGSTTFSVTDVDIPGNNALPVRVGRRFKIEDRRNESYLLGFGDWDIDLPRIEGVFTAANGWKILGSAPYARCSRTDMPDVRYSNAIVGPHDVWSGTYLYVPGQGSQELLINDSAKLRHPTDGTTYPWVTSGFFHISCLAQTANGYPGEAFVALGTDGVKYTFDYVVSRGTAPIKVSFPQQGQTPLARTRVSFLVTRVEDRFGNWVAYDYSAGKLTGIRASDGRALTLTYSGDLIQKVTANGRSWTYAYSAVSGYGYPATLASVTRPDGSKWTYSAVGTLKTLREAPVDGGQNTSCPLETDARYDETGYHLTIGHPSGAKVVFDFSFGRNYRNHTPTKQCLMPWGQQAPTPYAAHYWDGYRLTRKTLTGAGLSQEQWTYSYGAVSPSFYNSGQPTTACSTCQQSKTVTVKAPDGSYTRHVFGVMYGLNEGQLLRVEEGGGTSAPLSTTDTTYVETSEVAAQRFPDEIGTSRNLVWSFSNRLRPVRQTVITRDGATFRSTVTKSNSVYAFDAFGKTLAAEKASSLGYHKTDVTDYFDDLAHWVVGLPERQTVSGIEVMRTTYDSIALPKYLYRNGRLDRTFTWRADGTLGTIQDGAGHRTTLSSWYRGIPRTIGYADGTTQTAVVDANGWILSATDEAGARTCYGYDTMGRVNKITYPSETQLGVCDASAWTPTTITFSSGNPAAYGVPAGHWRQTTLTGNARKILILDALWRPVVEQTLDLANVSGTTSEIIRRYDKGGRLEFESYPMNTVGQAVFTDTTLTGTHTSYDAIGRVVKVEKDWELGSTPGHRLETTTEYKTGFRTLVTDPRGNQTLTTLYRAYDQPTYDFPQGINHPEDTYTEIYRDVFGKPTAIVRRNGANSVRETRRYVYNQYQQLCKTIDPEAGATVQHYDAAGNLDWSAAGLDLPSATDCNETDPSIAARRATRSYDARNRVLSVTFADGYSDTTNTYTPTGQLATISTTNDGVMPATTTYAYNNRGLMVSESIEFGSTKWGNLYTYDTYGNLSDRNIAGFNFALSPNALGQPTRVGQVATGIIYHPNGVPRQFTYGNGMVHTLAQNVRQLPERSRDFYGSIVPLDDSYDYDQNGNVLAISDISKRPGRPYGFGNRNMTYDGRDRLTDVVSPMFGSTGAHYEYDALDNLTRVQIGGPAGWASPEPRDHWYCYDPATWRLTNIKAGGCSGSTVIGLGYDVQGNVINKNGTVGGVYTFDTANRLRYAKVGSVTSSYLYDGHGRRIRDYTTGSKYSFYDAGGQLVYARDLRKNTQEWYLYLGSSLVAIRHRDVATGVSEYRYQHTDALGSPVAVTDQSRSIIKANDYEPYGRLMSGPLQDGPGYTGHVSDAATGLSYMQQRYYDPEIGRFLSIDPVAADMASGANFNRYWYANNSPYNFTDPDGRQGLPQFRADMAYQGYPSSMAQVHQGVKANAAAVASMAKAEGNARTLDKISAAGTALELAPTPLSPVSNAVGAVVAEAAGALAFMVSPSKDRAADIVTGNVLKAFRIAAEAKQAEKAIAATDVADTTHKANNVVAQAEHAVAEAGNRGAGGEPKSQVQEAREDDRE